MKFFRRKKKEEDAGQQQSPALEEQSAQPEQDAAAEDSELSQAAEEKAEASDSQTAVDTAEAEQLAAVAEASAVETDVGEDSETQQTAAKRGWFARMRDGLSRTGSQFGEGMGRLLFGKKEIDQELLEEIETQLLMADVGVDTTAKIIDELAERVARKQLGDGEALFKALRQSLADILRKVEAPLVLDSAKGPFVVLVVGVNGVGKTTTIGKLARRFQQEGKTVMLAAGDTFRAAAVEQLKAWGERNKVAVVAQGTGADSASVIFDALQSARSRGVDVLIADTAGRLHTKSHLMDELSKVKRVMAKLDEAAPHEVLLVLDAGTGQNALAQAEHFTKAVGVSGIALTKLDGTAKGGIIFALSDRFGLPIRYIGVGEGAEDLQVFEAETFVNALFASAEKALAG